MKTIALPPYAEVNHSGLLNVAADFVSPRVWSPFTNLRHYYKKFSDLHLLHKTIIGLRHYYFKAISRLRFRCLRFASRWRAHNLSRIFGLTAISLMGLTIIALQLRSIIF